MRRCPWSQIDALAWQLLECWADWRVFGTTAWGSPMSAPHPVYEAIRICESVANESRAKHERDATKQHERMLEQVKRRG